MAFDLDSVVTGVISRMMGMVGIARVPFYFGSTYSLGGEEADLPVAVDMSTRLTHPDQEVNLSFGNLSKFIRLSVNPSSLQLDPYVRIEEVNTGQGKTFYHWLDQNNKATMPYSLRLSGETGNLFPNAPDAKKKLYFYTKLRELTMEPYWIVTPTTKTTSKTVDIFEMGTVTTNSVSNFNVKTRNSQYIILQTIGLPVSIVFIGFYKKPITLKEDASNQYSLRWDFEFIIENMIPDITEISAVLGPNYIDPTIISSIMGM